ncbi:MAG: nuclear transport factor 2 family protein [Alphaproteobacteria bacterium]|nr:nuclear transport factor 2 family protein [Alphaproteobacteria bacterium]
MSAEDDILQLEERRATAMVAADTAALDEIMHEELTYMHSTGGADTKAMYLDGVGTGAFDYQKVDAEDRTIKIHGDIALVFFHMKADIIIRGNPRFLDNRVLAVYVREGGAWKLLAVQSGAIPEPAP